MDDPSFTLVKEQRLAFEYMAAKINVFITGMAGTGKSMVINMFMNIYKSQRKIGLTSTTGTSALLIGGKTLHSYLGIGLATGSVTNLVDMINTKKWLRERWISLETLIIDEVSMLAPDLFDKLEEVARLVRKSDKPFGGIHLVLSGDFLQLSCVSTVKFCFQAKSWNQCIEKIVYLKTIIRQKDEVFQRCLSKVRETNLDNDTKAVLLSRVGVNLENSFGIKPTKMFPHNYSVDLINDRELDNLAQDGREFKQYTMSIEADEKYYIDMYRKSCTAPDILQLCLDAQVMLLFNIDLENGLANGSRGIVIGFVDNFPLVKFMNGLERIITYNVWNVEEKGEVVMTIKQVPLRVAYATTIHKMQGATLDCVELDLSRVFAYGHAYVALSRVKSLDGLTISDINFDCFKSDPKAVEFYRNLKKND